MRFFFSFPPPPRHHTLLRIASHRITSLLDSAGPNWQTDAIDDDDDGPKIKERLIALSLKWLDICCVWDCSPCWVKFQKLISLFVYDPFIELFITLCIVVNTLFMALDHHGMNKDMERALKMGNYVRHAQHTNIDLSLSLSLSYRCYSVLYQ